MFLKVKSTQCVDLVGRGHCLIECNLFSPWNSWTIAQLALNNNFSLFWPLFCLTFVDLMTYKIVTIFGALYFFVLFYRYVSVIVHYYRVCISYSHGLTVMYGVVEIATCTSILLLSSNIYYFIGIGFNPHSSCSVR